jgi:hypothetical protein
MEKARWFPASLKSGVLPTQKHTIRFLCAAIYIWSSGVRGAARNYFQLQLAQFEGDTLVARRFAGAVNCVRLSMACMTVALPRPTLFRPARAHARFM